MHILYPTKKITRTHLSTTVTAVIKHCPYCGKRHEHGWGDGHRNSHCGTNTPNEGYILVCRD